MAKRFINPDWKQLRKLSEHLRQCYFYCWDKADHVGVYEYDPVYLKADLGFDVSFEDLLTLPEAKKISPEKIIFLNFLVVNYGTLRENYNPHKPVFRDLAKNKLQLDSSLIQACVKEEEEDEDEEEDEERKRGTVEKPKLIAEEEKFYPNKTLHTVDLSNDEMDNTIAYLEVVCAKEFKTVSVKNQWLAPPEIERQWKAFKIQYFNGETPYDNWGDVIQHFRDWLKNGVRKINKNGNESNSGSNGAHRSARDRQTDATNSLRDKLANVIAAGKKSPAD